MATSPRRPAVTYDPPMCPWCSTRITSHSYVPTTIGPLHDRVPPLDSVRVLPCGHVIDYINVTITTPGDREGPTEGSSD